MTDLVSFSVEGQFKTATFLMLHQHIQHEVSGEILTALAQDETSRSCCSLCSKQHYRTVLQIGPTAGPTNPQKSTKCMLISLLSTTTEGSQVDNTAHAVSSITTMITSQTSTCCSLTVPTMQPSNYVRTRLLCPQAADKPYPECLAR